MPTAAAAARRVPRHGRDLAHPVSQSLLVSGAPGAGGRAGATEAAPGQGAVAGSPARGHVFLEVWNPELFPRGRPAVTAGAEGCPAGR